MIELLTPVRIIAIDSQFYGSEMLVIDRIRGFPHTSECLYRVQFPGDSSFRPIYKESEIEVIESEI